MSLIFKSWFLRSSSIKRDSLLKYVSYHVSNHRELPLRERNREELSALYARLKRKIYFKNIKLVDVSNDVFVNNEVSLRHVNSFGFDYDYTLASYSDELHRTIYKIAVENLIKIHNYPKELQTYNYGDFPIRGLHFDTKNGFLMKIDSRGRIQMGTVYKGYEKVSDDEVVQQYGGSLIDVDLISSSVRRARIFQQTDLFSMALLSLLTNVIDYFMQNSIMFNPSYIFYDAESAIHLAYKSGKINEAIMNDLHKYSPKQKDLETYMNRLLSNGKKLFIITNSSFNFINKGMTHLFSADWRDLFEVVIVNARKPRFFNISDRASLPFRNINLQNGTYLWDQVKEFQKHGVYGQGNIRLFDQYTGFERSSVIYFGDHFYNNLMGPALRIGWRTGAVIPDLASEIKICNSEQYVRDMEWLITLEGLITALQVHTGSDTAEDLIKWRTERKVLRRNMKQLFNPSFGSMFRANENPSSFSKRVTHYSDLYTASLVNMLNYSDNFHFLPSRNLLPHERF